MPTSRAKRLPQQTKGKPPWVVRVQPNLRIGKVRCWGFCDYANREILICSSCERSGVDRDTFLHEMIHKICPWMAESAVDSLATELDDALDVMGL
jgi:hypothetical protein